MHDPTSAHPWCRRCSPAARCRSRTRPAPSSGGRAGRAPQSRARSGARRPLPPAPAAGPQPASPAAVGRCRARRSPVPPQVVRGHAPAEAGCPPPGRCGRRGGVRVAGVLRSVRLPVLLLVLTLAAELGAVGAATVLAPVMPAAVAVAVVAQARRASAPAHQPEGSAGSPPACACHGRLGRPLEQPRRAGHVDLRRKSLQQLTRLSAPHDLHHAGPTLAAQSGATLEEPVPSSCPVRGHEGHARGTTDQEKSAHGPDTTRAPDQSR